MTNEAGIPALDGAAPFWEGAARGVLMLKRCLETERAFHYPRDHSPFGGRNGTEWFEASGKGTIYSCSTAYRANPPYCIAYVTLDEGPLMMTNIIHPDLASVEIGQRVRVSFVPDKNGRPVPMFELAP